MMDLAAIYDIAERGDESLLTEDERAQLPQRQRHEQSRFSDNLAETLGAQALADIATAVYDGYTADDASRQPWRAREKMGIRLLGISENTDAKQVFSGASAAVHPGLAEAIIQFQARAISELWPPEGPVKALVEGNQHNAEREMQAKRVADYLNWLCATKMPGGYQHHDRMLFRLPLTGSAFKKVYFDALAGCVVSRFVPAEEVIVPYGAVDIETAPRITHVLSVTGSDVARLIESGAYRDAKLGRTHYADEKTDLQDEMDAVSGVRPEVVDIESSGRYVFIEQSVRLTVPGDPPNSPYLVTMERESQTVFAVYRDWREQDERRKRRERFAHYYFLPGLDGFYGLGLLHVLGRLAEAQSGNLRALLDAATLANLRGGFRSADVKLPGGNRKDGLQIKPGEWLPVEATVEELQKLFVNIPYGEPSQTLFSLLGYLDELMRRVAGTTGELMGQETKSVPVGTTLARIEQGLKVQNSIQIRCHHAQTKELELLVQATADNLPDAAYCKDVLGIEPEAFSADFDGRVDVRPVSNPNAITATQRMVIAQAIADRAAQSPDLYDRREVEKRLLETMRVGDVDALLPDRAQIQRMGPIEENMALTMMQPVRSQPDQDHAAHVAVHHAWLSTLTDPAIKKRAEPAALAHIAEHYAWLHLIQMQQATGMQLPAGPMGLGQPSDPQTENAIALVAANAVQIMSQQQAMQPAPADPLTAQAADKAAAEIARKDALASAQIQRDDAQAIARLNRDVAQQEARLVAQFVSDQSKQTLGQIQ